MRLPLNKKTGLCCSEIQMSQAKKCIIYKSKNLGNKSRELPDLKFSGRLLVSEMSHENQQLAYKCQFTLPGSSTIL